jgi:hypothetical protein
MWTIYKRIKPALFLGLFIILIIASIILAVLFFPDVIGILGGGSGFDYEYGFISFLSLFVALVSILIALGVWVRFRQSLAINRSIGYFEKNSRIGKEELLRVSAGDFEKYIRGLLEKNFWITKNPYRGLKKAGMNLMAEKFDEAGVNHQIFLSYRNQENPLLPSDIAAFNTALSANRNFSAVLLANPDGAKGILVCPGGFTADAGTEAEKLHLELWDYPKVVELAKTTES